MSICNVKHSFKKRPSAKNLANRSLSFTEDETSLIKDDDLIVISVKSPSFETEIQVSGLNFLKIIQDRTTKNGTKIKVFRF